MRPFRVAYLACVLCVFAPMLATAQTASELLARAQRETDRIRDAAQRALTLAELAQIENSRHSDQWDKTLASAVATVDDVDDPVAKALTWRGLAVRGWELNPELARQLMDKALKAARDLPYAAQRSLALREIGHSLVPLDKTGSAAAFTDALAAARKIDSPLFRSAGLRDLAEAWQPLDGAQAGKLFVEAAAALASIVPADEPVQLARIELAVSWSLSDVPSALGEAARIPDLRLREVCYRRMVEALAPVDPEAAMQVAGELHDQGERALAMAALAVALSQAQPETAAGMARAALEMGKALPEESLGHLQGAAAVAVARADLKAGLQLAGQVQDPDQVGRAKAQIAGALAASAPDQAAAIASEIDDWTLWESCQAQIIPLLAARDLPAALKLVDVMLSRREKVHALLQVIAGLPQETPAQPAQPHP